MLIHTRQLTSLPEKIAEIARDRPQSVALSQGNRSLTYNEVNTRSLRFGAYLRHLGVSHGDTVAICTDRSFEWILCALGAMWVGATYSPLDSDWPDSRLRLAIRDSGATVLAARQELIDRIRVETRGVDPYQDSTAIDDREMVDTGRTSASDIAYIIYTSGSTGLPKGVEVTHANLMHLIRWHQNAFDITSQDRASHLASLGFDAAVWEVWPHLYSGATVCIADDSIRVSAESIQEWMLNEHVTIGFVPTYHVARLLSLPWPSKTKLRFLLTGGDSLLVSPPTGLPFAVVNNYGPTECTVVTTSGIVEAQKGTPSIGIPISGANVYLINERGERVPDGTVGEIYVGGEGVASGYRNLAGATQESFIRDPFTEKCGARMYRTGDLGLRRSNGEIEFHGRLDRQIKIRGQRVELDEIDRTLMQHPGIDFAKAITRASSRNENEIVACFLPKVGADSPTQEELRRFLVGSLPNYMVPRRFVRLKSIPIAHNGKIDLEKLALSVDDESLTKQAAQKSVVSSIEQKVLLIIRELLGDDSVALGDSFFLTGGDSLFSMQLILRMREEFGVDLALQQLLDCPTAETLAAMVEIALDEGRLAIIWNRLLGQEHLGLSDNFFDKGGNLSLVAELQQCIATEFGQWISISELTKSPTIREHAWLTRRSRKNEADLPPGVLALHPNGTRNSIFWVHYRDLNLAAEFDEDQPFFFVTLSKEDADFLGVEPSLQQIAACLVRKILAAQPRGPYIVGGICLGAILAYEIALQLRGQGHEVSLVILLDPPSPPYVEPLDSLKRKASYFRYALTRAVTIGPTESLRRFRDHLRDHLGLKAMNGFDKVKTSVFQEISEKALFAYTPLPYEGKALLIFASERPSYTDYLPAWQSLISGNLSVRYVKSFHDGLLKPKHARTVAEIIIPHLDSKSGNATSCIPDQSILTQKCDREP